MNEQWNQFLSFLDYAHSSYHGIAAVENMLKTAGYEALQETGVWTLTPGGKYYLTRGGSGLLAFRVPAQAPTGFMMTACHADRPSFKIKENGELVGKYTRLSTEKYGGMLMAPWLDRPLSVAGRVMVQTEDGVRSRLVDIDKDLLLIPNVAIHMNRKANEGYAWNPAVDTLPLVGSEKAQGKLQALLEETAGGKILGHDLYLYVRQKASVWGLEDAYVSAQGLDDLACVWCCTQGFLKAGETTAIPMLCIFDSEEVGSASVQGADSRLLEMAVSRICKAVGADADVLLSRSFMLSADNAHAVHPNHPEYADANNAPVLGGGVVLKFNGNLRYATDGLSAAVFRKVCEKAGVPVQTYYNRADLPGGSTLGCISVSHVSVPTADIGIAQLAMHSCYETLGLDDVKAMEKALTTYYGVTLSPEADGTVAVL